MYAVRTKGGRVVGRFATRAEAEACMRSSKSPARVPFHVKVLEKISKPPTNEFLIAADLHVTVPSVQRVVETLIKQGDVERIEVGGGSPPHLSLTQNGLAILRERVPGWWKSRQGSPAGIRLRSNSKAYIELRRRAFERLIAPRPPEGAFGDGYGLSREQAEKLLATTYAKRVLAIVGLTIDEKVAKIAEQAGWKGRGRVQLSPRRGYPVAPGRELAHAKAKRAYGGQWESKASGQRVFIHYVDPGNNHVYFQLVPHGGRGNMLLAEFKRLYRKVSASRPQYALGSPKLTEKQKTIARREIRAAAQQSLRRLEMAGERALGLEEARFPNAACAGDREQLREILLALSSSRRRAQAPPQGARRRLAQALCEVPDARSEGATHARHEGPPHRPLPEVDRSAARQRGRKPLDGAGDLRQLCDRR
jgi:hypothetical protein